MSTAAKAIGRAGAADELARWAISLSSSSDTGATS
jgi:hypothetical protein